MGTAFEYAQAHGQRFVDQLSELLRIPSVSTMPEHAADVERAARWLVEDMQRLGIEAQIFQKDGYLPLVYGEWNGAGPDAPTALLYCHYDVQPAFLADGWDTEPFTPTLKDGRIYARGAVDSKGHVIANLKAIESMLNADEPCPVNLKILFEGEEESGSEHIFQFVGENSDLLHADVCVVSDGSMPDLNQPVLDYGLRGIITFEVIVSGPQRDLHSGHYGGNIHNPLQALVEILAQLHDESGHVTVPGFYDAVQPLSAEERETLAGITELMEKEWHDVTGAPALWGEPEYRVPERVGARPTLEINGIAGGYYGEGFKTVIPARAIAKVSCRLVPNQEPVTIYTLVSDYLRQLASPTIKLEVKLLEEGAPGIVLDRSSTPMQAAFVAYESAWGVRPLYSRAGGSIPVVSAFQKHLKAPIVLLPYGYKGCGAHSVNEHMYLNLFHRGIATAITFYHEFAAMFKSTQRG
jgi:acetylornithine deacetylase/succinyl-diaminopimelate desuccinylase-like protein